VALGAIVLLIFIFGIYPQPLLNITDVFTDKLMQDININHLLVK
jgi:NADH-quinone oxidoreductase subunit M